MTDQVNWQSAFSEDSLDGALDKAKQAKSKFDEVTDTVSESPIEQFLGVDHE